MQVMHFAFSLGALLSPLLVGAVGVPASFLLFSVPLAFPLGAAAIYEGVAGAQWQRSEAAPLPPPPPLLQPSQHGKETSAEVEMVAAEGVAAEAAPEGGFRHQRKRQRAGESVGGGVDCTHRRLA
jgi:hypothetical protein